MLKIALLESDAAYEQLESRICSFFNDVLEISVEVIDVRGLTSIVSKKSPFFREVVDVFISDISLGAGIGNSDGLTKLNKVKCAMSDICCIAISSYYPTLSQIENNCPDLDLFIEKEAFLRDSSIFKDRIEGVIKKNHNVVVAEDSAWVNTLSDPRRVRLSKVDVERSIRSIFGHRSGLVAVAGEPLCMSLEVVDRGFSRGRVFTMFVETGSGNSGRSAAILKYADSDSALEEVENYQTFVEWLLPVERRPYLKSYVAMGSVGCICYSYLFSSEDKVYSLSELTEKDDLRVEAVIRKVFDPNNSYWYENTSNSSLSINEYYGKKLFSNPKFMERSLQEYYKLLSDVDQSSYPAMTIAGFEIGDPRTVIMGRMWNDVDAVVCHGDLHGGNILVSGDDYGLIDFDCTGFGHKYEDFVALEVSVRLSLKRIGPSREEIEECFGSEIQAIDGNYSQEIRAHSYVKLIRDLAQENFGELGIDYWVALAYRTFFLIRVERLPEEARRCLSCLLAACIKHVSTITN